jgi:hypothetical protein
MNRDQLESELKCVGVSLNGWLPMLHCDKCNAIWEPFASVVNGPSAPTARLDYWMCPNRCNEDANVGMEIKTAIPRYVMINDVPGMIFDDDDLPDFERYVRSMDVTQVFNR